MHWKQRMRRSFVTHGLNLFILRTRESRNVLWHRENVIRPRSILLCASENAGLLPPADQKANCSVSSFTSTSVHRPAARVVTDCGYSRCLQSLSQDLHQTVVKAWSDCPRDIVGHLPLEPQRWAGCFHSLGDWMFQERKTQYCTTCQMWEHGGLCQI